MTKPANELGLEDEVGDPKRPLDEPRRCIVVIGMHRSGADRVAGALIAAGAWAADAEEPILETQLEELGGSWRNPPLERLQPWEQENIRPALRAALSGALAGAPRQATPIVNDPRLCLFAGELKTLLAEEWPVVVAVRHPLEVARSLHDRDGLPIQAGLALWEIYNGSLCAGMAGRAVHVVRPDAMVRDLAATAELLDHVLGDGQGLNNAAYERATAHLTENTLHHHADLADEDRWLSVSALRLWHQLDAASNVSGATTLPAVEVSHSARQHVQVEADRQRLARENAAFREADSTAVAELQTAQASLSDENARLIERLQGLRDLRAKALEGWAETERAHMKLVQEASASEQHHRDSVRQMLVQVDALCGELEAIRSGYLAANGLTDADGVSSATVTDWIESQLEESAKLISELRAQREENTQVWAELAKIERHRQELIVAVNSICSSQSWRVGHALTWPVRVARRGRPRAAQLPDPE
ncbi:MAG TPA: hypothetical protein VHW74_09800 [Mycobacteriales bacterium]|nr:hypothetical protein [Mycobacteriales bacterium]